MQRSWFNDIYPPEVAWHLHFTLSRYRPGFLRSLERALNGESMEHWVAYSQNKALGFVTWEPSRWSADPLWLAVSMENEDLALRSLLPHVRQTVRNSNRPLVINYPAGRAETAFQSAGFSHQLTLIWMEAVG